MEPSSSSSSVEGMLMGWFEAVAIVTRDTGTMGSPKIYTCDILPRAPYPLDRQGSTNTIAFPLAIKTFLRRVSPEISRSLTSAPAVLRWSCSIGSRCPIRGSSTERRLTSLALQGDIDEWRNIVLSSGRGLAPVIQIHSAANH